MAIFAIQPVHLYGEKFVFSVTAQYVVCMLKLQYHYASFDKFYNLNAWIVLHRFIKKFGRFLLFSLYICKCNCSVRRSYVKTVMLPLQFNAWIIPASLYSKVRVIFALPCSTVYFYEISRFLRILDNSKIEDYKLLYTTSYSSDCYSLENSV